MATVSGAIEYSGAVIPLTVADTPPSDNARGSFPVCWREAARFEPRTMAIAPGASAGPPDAAFETLSIVIAPDEPTTKATLRAATSGNAPGECMRTVAS